MAANYQIRSILPADDAGSAGRRGVADTRFERGRAPKSNLDDTIVSSVRTVERAVESFGALKEQCVYFRDMADDLRRALDEESSEHKAAGRQIDELERLLRSERDRSKRLEELLAAADERLTDLERELDAMRGRTEHLVETIAQLVVAEDDAAEFRRAA